MESPEEELVGEAGVGPVDRQEEVDMCKGVTLSLFTTGEYIVNSYTTHSTHASMPWIHTQPTVMNVEGVLYTALNLSAMQLLLLY